MQTETLPGFGAAIQDCKDGACRLWIATPKPVRNDSTLVTGQNFWRLVSFIP